MVNPTRTDPYKNFKFRLAAYVDAVDKAHAGDAASLKQLDELLDEVRAAQGTLVKAKATKP